MPKDIYSATSTSGAMASHDPQMLVQMTGETTSLMECSTLGRKLIQSLLLAPTRTDREAEAAIRLATVLGAVLPILEENVPNDVWTIS